MNNYFFFVICVLTLNYAIESEAFFARRLFLRKNINPIVYSKDGKKCLVTKCYIISYEIDFSDVPSTSCPEFSVE